MEKELIHNLLESGLDEDGGKYLPRSMRSTDFLARAMRSSAPDFLSRVARSPNSYLVRTMRST